MIRSRSLNLNGLVLDGTTPIPPVVQTFLTAHGANVQQSGGFVTITGNHSINAQEVAAFLATNGIPQAAPPPPPPVPQPTSLASRIPPPPPPVPQTPATFLPALNIHTDRTPQVTTVVSQSTSVTTQVATTTPAAQPQPTAAERRAANLAKARMFAQLR